MDEKTMEPTFEEMRVACWQNFGYPNHVDANPEPPVGWPGNSDALDLLYDVRVIVGIEIMLDLSSNWFTVRTSEHSESAATLGEAAVRLAYAMLPKEDNNEKA